MTPDHREVLIQARLQQAEDSLRDAAILLAQSGAPRSVVNRAYYAMFYMTLALLQDLPRIPSKHAGVIRLFDQEFVRPGVLPKELSKDLHRAFRRRQKGDYEQLAQVSQEEAEDIYRRAMAFVGALKAHLGKK